MEDRTMMIEFEDRCEENQRALLAYLAGEKHPVTSPNRDWLSGTVSRLAALPRRWRAAGRSGAPGRSAGDSQTEPECQSDPLFHFRLSRNPEREFLRFFVGFLQASKEPHGIGDERAG